MEHDDYCICTISSCLRDCGSDGWNDIADVNLRLREIGCIPQIGARCRRSDYPNANTRAADDCERRIGMCFSGAGYIRREQGKRRLRNGAIQIWYTVIELMVADRRRVVMHRVHRRDYRIPTRFYHAGRDIGQRRSLQQIACVEQDYSSQVGRARNQRSSRRG